MEIAFDWSSPIMRSLLQSVPAFICALAIEPASAALEFGLPIDCPRGRCRIQNYVDRDPGPSVRDHACGQATYDGHKGVDFRLGSAAAATAGVPIRAAAAGVVKAVRDGVPDRLVNTTAERARLKGRECGNGVVIDHGDGLETQYCHMRQGSIRVRSGGAVAAGAQLGFAGYSGDAAFAHVHFEARRDGAAFDPFDADCASEQADPPARWSQQARSALPSSAEATLDAAFAAGPVSTNALEAAPPPAPDATSLGFVFYARFMNLRAGDVVRLTVTGPQGFAASSETAPLERAKATYVAFAGKRLTAARWPAGEYRGHATVIRTGTIILDAKAALRIN